MSNEVYIDSTTPGGVDLTFKGYPENGEYWYCYHCRISDKYNFSIILDENDELYADALGDVLFESWFVAPFGKHYFQWRIGHWVDDAYVYGEWGEVQSFVGEFIDGD